MRSPFINTGNKLPGIISLLFYKSSTGKALSNLAHSLLKGPSPLTSSERETIATYVSRLNECEFCSRSHGAALSWYPDSNSEKLEADDELASFDPRMRALLRIAGKVQVSGKEVMNEDIQIALNAGCSEEEIHDTVLIAAAFCMYNRYVDGLRTSLPESENEYTKMGHRLFRKGYKYPPFFIRWLIPLFAR
jgi:uncharacterized peroxidase-related enzyme